MTNSDSNSDNDWQLQTETEAEFWLSQLLSFSYLTDRATAQMHTGEEAQKI